MTPYYRDDLAELWHHDARRVSDVIEPGHLAAAEALCRRLADQTREDEQ